MTGRPGPARPNEPGPHDAMAALQALYGPGVGDVDDIPATTHWPSLPADDAAAEWDELRVWVEGLQARFEHLVLSRASPARVHAATLSGWPE